MARREEQEGERKGIEEGGRGGARVPKKGVGGTRECQEGAQGRQGRGGNPTP